MRCRIARGRRLQAVVDGRRSRRDAGRAIVWGLGAHVIKTGLSPVLVDLMAARLRVGRRDERRRHHPRLRDRASGATSEDVDAALAPGNFGMAEETGPCSIAAINDGVADGHRHGPVGRAFAVPAAAAIAS